MAALTTNISHILLLLSYTCVVLRASQIEDCCCDTETVSANNQQFLNEILTVLRKRTFFRIFKVDIYKSCALWEDNALCFQPTCSVQECCDDDVPQKWRDLDAESMRHNRPVDLFIDSNTFAHWPQPSDYDDEDQWVSYPSDEDLLTYIDLERNPDGYTGYKGEEAGKVWRAIYEAKALLYRHIDDGHRALYETEERVLFRLISGFHTLTTAMVFANWPIPDRPGQYGPNLELYEKVLHGHADWIGNLYFDFVFVLRAVNKAADVLSAYDYSTGNPSDDAMAAGLVHYLLHTDFIREQCNHENSFDESTLFQDSSGLIRDNFRGVFRNISSILDCVGCEKCKLHAKVEVLGLGTALKILFTKDVLSQDMFERNEILALVVTLAKYSDAIQFVEEMEERIEVRELTQSVRGAETESETEKEERDIWAVDEGHGFDALVTRTMANVFEADESGAPCKEWTVFCEDEEREVEARTMAGTICELQRRHCGQ